MTKKNDNNEEVKKLLRKLGEQNVEYPKDLHDRRRNSFIRQVFSRKFTWLWIILLSILLCILVNNFLSQLGSLLVG